MHMHAYAPTRPPPQRITFTEVRNSPNTKAPLKPWWLSLIIAEILKMGTAILIWM